MTDRNLRLFATLRSDAPPELYDRAADPTEQHDLAASDPESAQRLRALVGDYVEDARVPWDEPPREVDLDELHLNHLRALGYVIEP